jgi:uncharacterized repeat protein (TIGR01451 family)
MFKKLVSNLPFSPSLIGQLGFYARRLKKEQSVRKLGLIFTIFALVVQSFSVFSPPESANAASQNDVAPQCIENISGTQAKINCFLKEWDNPESNIGFWSRRFGITRDDIANMEYRAGAVCSGDWHSSFGMENKSYNRNQLNWNGRTIYWDNTSISISSERCWGALVGRTGDGITNRSQEFAFIFNCGNFVFKEFIPDEPRVPDPSAACDILNADPASGVADTTTFNFGLRGSTADGASISGYRFGWSGDGKSGESWSGFKNQANWSTTFGNSSKRNNATYTVTGTINTSLGEKTSANCQKTVTVAPKPDPSYTIEKTEDNNKTTASPDETLDYTITFRNTGNQALTNVEITDQIDSSAYTVVKQPSATATSGSATDIKTEKISTNGKFKVTIGSVAVDSVISVKYSLKVKPKAQLECEDNVILNKASARATEINIPSESTWTVTITNICDFSQDLQKAIVGDNRTFAPNEVVNYSLVFTNTGNRELTNVVIKDDLLDTGMTLVEGSISVAPKTNLGSTDLTDLFNKDKGLVINSVSAVEGLNMVTITYSATTPATSEFEECGEKVFTNHAISTTQNEKGENVIETNPDNNEQTITVNRPCDCTDTETLKNDPDCQTQKTAINNSQGGVDATTVAARGGDVITFTIRYINDNPDTTVVSIKDMLDDVLEYADLTDNGGGEFNEADKTLSWNNFELEYGQSATRRFSVTVKNPVPSVPQGTTQPLSYDCVMSNSIDNSKADIAVNCPPEKTVEIIVKDIPKTGIGGNIVFGAVLLAVVVFFYARSKQLGKEVRLVRKDFNAGTL